MIEESNWSKELNERLRNDPVYLAENVALSVSMQVNSVLIAEGIARKAFAERLGVSQPYVSQILGGQTNMTILTLSKVACALGLNLSVNMEKQLALRSESYKSSLDLIVGLNVANEVIPVSGSSSKSVSDATAGCFDSTVRSCHEEAFVA
jgi:transcriptional regulator with XRE-family HTH domain